VIYALVVHIVVFPNKSRIYIVVFPNKSRIVFLITDLILIIFILICMIGLSNLTDPQVIL